MDCRQAENTQMISQSVARYLEHIITDISFRSVTTKNMVIIK